MQAQSMNAAVENLRVKQCGMLLAYSSTRHPAVTPGQTRQALLQASAPTLPACCSVFVFWPAKMLSCLNICSC